jgi:hypothetical protein
VDIGLVRRILHVNATASVRPAEAMMPVRRPAAFSKHGVAEPRNGASALILHF